MKPVSTEFRGAADSIDALHQVEGGERVTEVCRRLGVASRRSTDPNPETGTRERWKTNDLWFPTQAGRAGQGDADDAPQRLKQRRDHPRPTPGRGRRESHRGLSPAGCERADVLPVWTAPRL